MKNLKTLQKALIAGVVVAAFGLAGCEADGNGLESGGIIGDGSDNGGLGANDGSTPTTVNEDLDDDGTAETVVDGGKGFVCTMGATGFSGPDGATTEVEIGSATGRERVCQDV